METAAEMSSGDGMIYWELRRRSRERERESERDGKGKEEKVEADELGRNAICTKTSRADPGLAESDDHAGEFQAIIEATQTIVQESPNSLLSRHAHPL